ncbi:hypothetical protein DFJ63DRAFT_335964 [Scheffersomyces coipomensis]|uniref:uncharacterized protein n=1 Tax=Scheffersomyces coipomensis TaxID=1788519 RepID=UPI00315C6B68
MLRFNPMQRIAFTLRGGNIGVSPIRAMTMRRTPSLPFKSNIFKRFQSSTIKPPPVTPPKEPTGVKALVKKYGVSALGVYLALTAIDLPICYVVVHSAGKDQIEYYENKAFQTFGYGVSEEELKEKQRLRRIEEAESADKEDKSSKTGVFNYLLSQFSWTEFAIAYGIHKSLIFIRLPITAAITPGIVRILRGWGFNIGAGGVTAAASAAAKKINPNDVTANLNPKFGTRPDRKKKWFAGFF